MLRNAVFALALPLVLLTPLLLPTAARQANARMAPVAYCPPLTIIQPRPIVPHALAENATNRPVQVQNMTAHIDVRGNVARTNLELTLQNPSDTPERIECLLPIPSDATVRQVRVAGRSGHDDDFEVLAPDRARQAYQQHVTRYKDPILLEFVGCGLVRTRVIPVECGQTLTVSVSYEQILPSDGPRLSYTLPRAEALGSMIPWQISANVDGQIATIYSPTHTLKWERKQTSTDVQVTSHATGPLHLAVLRGQQDLVTSVYTYPEGDGGYFLLLAGAPQSASEENKMPRDITLVIDRSGSMRGEKIAQVQEAAQQILASLAPNERIQLISYNAGVTAHPPVFAHPEQRAALQQAVQAIRTGGATNLHDALQTALQSERVSGHLPLVLFMSDGLPTHGIQSEADIRKLLTTLPGKRVYPVGIGADVNSPLMEGLAADSRGRATFVLPGENIKVALTRVFENLEGPVVTDLDFVSQPDMLRVHDLQPQLLPDLFADDQLVVLGRYSGTEPFSLTVGGTHANTQRTFQITVDPSKGNTHFDFVPRLWASRRIAQLTHEIRQQGVHAAHGKQAIQERIDTIIDLSVKFGVLTEYTAFLATDKTDLSDQKQVKQQASGNYWSKAVQTRSGMGSVNQSWNNTRQMAQAQLNRDNTFLDGGMKMQRTRSVCQVRDWAFFQRDGRWIDSRLVREDKPQPDRIVRYGTPAFTQLLDRLLSSRHQAVVALKGEILLKLDGQRVLIQNQP